MELAPSMEFDEQLGFIERREGQRHISVLRVGRMVHDGRDQLCIVRNVSAGGMMIEAARLPAIGTAITVELRSDKRLAASVRWNRGQEAGIMFDTPVDLAWLLKEERQSILRTQPRAPRFSRAGHARVIGTECVDEGAITNISINGVGIRTTVPFAREEPVVVALEGLGAAHASVRWSRAGETGLKLARPLSYRALAEWLEVRALEQEQLG